MLMQDLVAIVPAIRSGNCKFKSKLFLLLPMFQDVIPVLLLLQQVLMGHLHGIALQQAEQLLEPDQRLLLLHLLLQLHIMSKRVMSV